MIGRRLNKKETKKLAGRVRKAIKAGRVECGNEAILHKNSPYIKVFDHTKKGYNAGFLIHWAEPGRGFGELTFVVKHGQLEIQTEFMGIKFVKRQVLKLLGNAKVVE